MRLVPLALASLFALAGCAAEDDSPLEESDAATPPVDAGGSAAGGRDGGQDGGGRDGGREGGADAQGRDLDAGRPGDPPGQPTDGALRLDARVAREAAAPPPDASPSSRDAGSTALQALHALRAHNEARARAPASPPLPALSWSDEVARFAQSYAEQLASRCERGLVHSMGSGYGENLASIALTGSFVGQPDTAWDEVVAWWESELACYTFGAFQSGVNATCSSQCVSYGGCGHYTQLVWRKTSRVGCGLAECTRGDSRTTYFVCNYDPPGNYIGQEPY